jgi:hypothetical protein
LLLVDSPVNYFSSKSQVPFRAKMSSQRTSPVKKPAEKQRFLADYLKHLTTLSTWSILLIGSFLEKLFSHPHWKLLVIVALVGFLISILGATLSFTMVVGNFDDELKDVESSIAMVGIAACWVGFISGIFCLTIFTIKNIQCPLNA